MQFNYIIKILFRIVLFLIVSILIVVNKLKKSFNDISSNPYDDKKDFTV